MQFANKAKAIFNDLNALALKHVEERGQSSCVARRNVPAAARGFSDMQPQLTAPRTHLLQFVIPGTRLPFASLHTQGVPLAPELGS